MISPTGQRTAGGLVLVVSIAAVRLDPGNASLPAQENRVALEKRPNIVFFMLADNLGYGELGVYGGGASTALSACRA